jgi:hypothetical protein
MGDEVAQKTRAVKTRSMNNPVREQETPECHLEYTNESLRREQMKDADIGTVYKWVKDGIRPPAGDVAMMSQATRHYWHLFRALRISNGILTKVAYKDDSPHCFLQVIAPKKYQKEAMIQAHDAPLGGHLGRKKTKAKVSRNFYWYNMGEDIRAYVSSCVECQKNKKLHKNPKGELGNMLVGAPLDRISTDILGPLPTSQAGNKYILTVTDHFTNWSEAYPIKDQHASTVARKIVDEFISRFGCPLTIHSDQGSNYESQLFKEVCDLFHIKKSRSSPRHPQGNGKTERFNRTLLSMIKCFIKDQQDTWDQSLACITGAYRASVHEATGMTPNLIMLGREVRMPIDLMLGTTDKAKTNPGDYVLQLRQNLERSYSIAREKSGSTAKRQKIQSAHCVSISMFCSRSVLHFELIGR